MLKSIILIVEDDPDILEVLSLYVDNAGYRTLKAMNLADAWQHFTINQPDLVLLDVNLPDGNGFELARKIRSVSDTILIFITVNNSIDDKLDGFYVGADDYITKPFIPKEVIARIQAHLKRKTPRTQDNIIEFGNLTIHFDQKIVYKNGEIVNLFIKEKQLLFYLIENANKVLHPEQLINQVWGYDSITDIKTVSVHISTLRKKIEVNPSKPQMIQTVRGFGYKFVISK